MLPLSIWAQKYDCQIDTAQFTLVSKDTYEVAYFIPLSLDKSITGSALSKKNFNKFTKYYYEFYQGVLMALDQLNEENPELPQLNVQIIDSESPKVGMSSWSSSALEKFDFIFSAMSDDENKLALRLAKSKTPLVSCLSLADIDAPYPYYIHVQPTLQVHCENIAQEIKSKYGPEYQITSITDGSTVSSSALGYSGLREQSKLVKLDYDFNTQNLASQLDSYRVNIIFAPLLNETNAKRLLDSLNTLRDFQFDIYGMPTWYSMDLPKYTKSGRNTIVITTGFYKSSKTKGRNFIQAYQDRYSTTPNGVSMKGYETTLYFLKKFIYRPEYFFIDLVDDKGPRPINEFRIRARCDEKGFSYWENQNTYSILSENGRIDLDFE